MHKYTVRNPWRIAWLFLRCASFLVYLRLREVTDIVVSLSAAVGVACQQPQLHEEPDLPQEK